MTSPQPPFGDYQTEIYFNALQGVLPDLPMAYPELEERARRRCRPRSGRTSPAAPGRSGPSGRTPRPSIAGA